MNTELDKRTPWPFTPMTTPASSTQNAQPLAKRSNPKRRLTEDEKNRIAELHEQGMTNADIGREIGCTDVAVGYALKKRRIAQQQTADAAQPEPAILETEPGAFDARVKGKVEKALISQVYRYKALPIGNHEIHVDMDTCCKADFPAKLVIRNRHGEILKEITASVNQLITLGEALVDMKGFQ